MTDPLPIMADIALKIVQIGVFLGGGLLVIFKLGRITERVEQTMLQQSDELRELKEETKQVATALTQLALQEQRLNLLDKRFEELRHGEGFVYPLMFDKGIR